MRSQATHYPHSMHVDMEARGTEIKEKLGRVMETMEDLWWENEELKHHNIEFSKATLPSHYKQVKGEAQSTRGTNVEELEKNRLHDKLCSLVD